MFVLCGRGSVLWAVLVASALLAGCSSTRLNRAPVEDRGTGMGRPAPVQMDPNTQAVKQPPGFENAGKAGYYTVKPGDTLYRIGLDAGQNWRDIQRWNSIENPGQIEVGQTLRVVPPTNVMAPASSVAVAKPVTGSGAAVNPVASSQASASPLSSSTAGEDEIAWIWPTKSTSVLAGFDEVKNKGLDIAGTAGDPVMAAADGRVVYVGAGLRGYGNLIILKHNNTYLTAYAHNQTLLVKEDQTVQKGQKIAEMGNSDADRVKLHFEVRRQGKPVDPAKYLPTR
ncbi:MAG: peptidoglycan DD-metalloendopeptidase family protein [Gammaproteobacteria bacterium]|nr:peptidoglycan DD-metalloendopeptidase family protein [Gammaproteobacteria bacterium]MBU0786336.1 peptidoglycan DD-metalloendopeptidase family protein [Gammaproteobacteria bacterium]MBU0814444.1 peptidoglycan DD-metalloendopeptidase family protein [Gammaproteobacteria bacterium]MBU1786713.1 peptidoglycan DD-metalloendopeptidase family protein [Gammaproteobacteria bacterium]